LALTKVLGQYSGGLELTPVLAIFRRLGIDQKLGNIQEAWHCSKAWQYSGGFALIKVLAIFRRLGIDQSLGNIQEAWH
jgi:hypothetical protein